MNVEFVISPISIPLLTDLANIKLMFGLCLFLSGALVFSMWKDRLYSLKEEERTQFLLFKLAGGAWLISVFAVCGGVYFLFDSIFKLHL